MLFLLFLLFIPTYFETSDIKPFRNLAHQKRLLDKYNPRTLTLKLSLIPPPPPRDFMVCINLHPVSFPIQLTPPVANHYNFIIYDKWVERMAIRGRWRLHCTIDFFFFMYLIREKAGKFGKLMSDPMLF